MDQATSSSWKLLPWPILGGFNKKARADKSLKKVSAFKRRLQAHAAITRSLSPFCARTSFDSAAVREEENKCLLSLSAFIHACGRCTSSSLRDVDDIVPLGPLHSPHQHKAYINAIHHHLFTDHQPTHHETYLHMEILSPRIAQNKAFVEPSHIDKSVSLSREANPSQHHHRHMTPSRRAHIKKIGVIQCHENEIKANKQEKNHQQDHRQGITKAKGELKPVSRHGKCHCGPKGPSFDSGDDNWIEHAHNDGKPSTSSLKKCHHRPNDPSLATSSKSNWYVHAHNRKPNTSSLISSGTKPLAELETHHKRDSSANGKTKTKISQLEADLHICTPTHVLKQHRGKMKAFEEDMHQYKDQDPPILKNTHHHKHASKDPSRKRVHRLARKSKDTHWHAIEEPQSLKESHYHPSDVSSLTESTHHPHTNTRHSTSGFVFVLAGGAISWKSRKQSTVALSSMEAEYVAAALAAKEGIWIKRLLEELPMFRSLPIILYLDNQSCIHLAKNPKHHEKTKHVDFKYHFFRELVEEEKIQLEYTPTEYMWADFLTKAVPKAKHDACCSNLGIRAIPDPKEGGV